MTEGEEPGMDHTEMAPKRSFSKRVRILVLAALASATVAVPAATAATAATAAAPQALTVHSQGVSARSRGGAPQASHRVALGHLGGFKGVTRDSHRVA